MLEEGDEVALVEGKTRSKNCEGRGGGACPEEERVRSVGTGTRAAWVYNTDVGASSSSDEFFGAQ